MSNKSGFYRVTTTKRGNKSYFKYTIKNPLIKKEIIRKDIYELKQAVENCGLLWGITDLKKAKENSGEYQLKVLKGRYGLKSNS